jgi:hypothetical protein
MDIQGWIYWKYASRISSERASILSATLKVDADRFAIPDVLVYRSVLLVWALSVLLRLQGCPSILRLDGTSSALCWDEANAELRLCSSSVNVPMTPTKGVRYWWTSGIEGAFVTTLGELVAT